MFHRLSKGAALGALASVLISVAPADAGPTLQRRARLAASYLASHQNEDGSFPGFSPLGSTADAVTSLVAARRAPSSIQAALDYLEAHATEAETLGQKAKLVLAAVAGGRDPRSFGGQDLVQPLLDSEQDSGQYGASTPNDPFDGEVTDHVLVMLALAAAPDADPSSNSIRWLLVAQCEDGGWQHTGPQSDNENSHCFTGNADEDFFRSDTNTTSLAVQAVAAHPEATAPYPNSPFRFFRKIRDPRKNGWGYSWDVRLTDANSTALVIQAYAAYGKALPEGALRALKQLQHRLCGEPSSAAGFAYTWEPRDGAGYRKGPPDGGATIGAIPALLKRPFPIAPAEVTKPAPGIPSC